MKRIHTRAICFIFFTLLPLVGDGWASSGMQSMPAGLRGPVMGYVLDETTETIRSVKGIPGSSLLGQPLALPFPVTAAAFSPRGDFAVVISGLGDRSAHVLRNLSGALTIDTIEGGIGGADRVVLNADASAAALLASDGRRLQLLRGLPAEPTMGQPVDISSIQGTITALAVDRTGSNILIAASADYGALYSVANDVAIPPRLIATFGSPSALALLNGEQDVIVADAALNELILVRNFAGASEVFHLAGERDGVSKPVGLRISLDNRKLYIANGASQTLDIWNFQTQSIEASLPLDARPTQLTPFQGSSMFVLNAAGDRPLVLLDAADSPAIYFVPAIEDR